MSSAANHGHSGNTGYQEFGPPVVQMSLGDCWQRTLCRRSDRKRRRRIVETVACG